MRPIEWLDRNPWGDVHNDAVTSTLTAPVDLGNARRTPDFATVGTGDSLQMVTARRSRGTRYPPFCTVAALSARSSDGTQNGVICVRATRESALLTSARLVASDDQGGQLFHEFGRGL